MPTQKIDPKVIFASNAPAIDKPPVFSDKTKGWGVARANDGRPEIKQMNKVQQDTDLKILWLNENAVLPYDLSIDYPDGAVAIKDGSFKQLASGAWVEFLDDFANKDEVKRGIANRYDSSLTYNSGERVVLTNGDIVKSTVDANTNDPNVDMTGWELDRPSVIPNPADLLSLPNPYTGQRAFVTSLQKWYTYNINLTTPENSVTIVGKWEMDTQDYYLASWFATQNSNVSQSLLLQTGLAYATSKFKPFIIDGSYYIDGRAIDCALPNADKCGLLLLENSKLLFYPNASLNIIPNAYPNYHGIIACNNIANYYVFRPVINGDRVNHDYSSGGTHEWGYGLTIYESSNGMIVNPKINDTTGDGLYIGKAWSSALTTVPKDIIVSDLVVNRIRRNGFSFTAGDNVRINNGVVFDTRTMDGINPVSPMSAIDIEPEEVDGTPSAYIRNSVIHNFRSIRCNRSITFGIFKQGREVDVKFTGTTIVDITDSYNFGLTIYNSRSNGVTQQNGKINIEHLHIQHATGSDMLFDIESKDVGTKFIVEKLTMQNINNFNVSLSSTVDDGIQYANFSILDAIFEDFNSHIFRLNFFYLSTATRSTAKPNFYIKFNDRNIPSSTMDWDYSGNNKSVGDYFYCNSVVTRLTNDYFNQNTLHSNIVKIPAISGAATTLESTSYREMTYILDGLTNFTQNYFVISGLGANTRFVDYSGATVTASNMKVEGYGSWVKLKRISSTQIQVLDFMGKIQQW